MVNGVSLAKTMSLEVLHNLPSVEDRGFFLSLRCLDIDACSST